MNFQIRFIPLVLILALSGCSQKSAEELVLDAQQKIAAGQNSAGIIELKNALQKAPNNPQARFLLGKMYIERGAAAAAEKELKQALKLGYEKNEVLPLLASAYNLQFKNQDIIDLVSESINIDPTIETSLLLYRALAYFQLDKAAKAKQMIAQANELSAESVYSKLGSAYLAFSNSQLNDSLAKTDEILALQPELTEALLLKGQLATLNKNYPLAVESFEKYHRLLPDMILGRVFLANAYIKNQQYNEAEQYLDELLKMNKNQPFFNQLKGFVRYQAKDFVGANLYTDVAIQNGLSSAPNRVIAGISAFQQKNYEQAYRHLSAIEDDLPKEHPMQKLLAMVKLKLGMNVEASDTLLSMVNMTENDIVLMSAASAQLIRDGNIQEARALVEKTASITFTDPVRMAEKGMMRLSLDDLEGLTDLERALSLNPELDSANTALARAYIDGGSYNEALKLADVWINQKPEQVNGYVLAALAYTKLTQLIDAEAMYNKALQIDQGNPAANLYFADQAVTQQKPAQAITFLEHAIESYPNYIPVLSKYFVLQQDSGNVEDGLAPITTAFSSNQQNLNYRLLYARALFTAKRYTSTIELLEAVEASDQTPNAYWVVLGNAYFYNQQIIESLALAKKWIEQQPNNSAAHSRLISLSEINQDNQGALEAAQKAKEIFSQDTAFSAFVTYFAIATNDIPQADREWQQLPDEIKSNVFGQGLLGQISLEKGQAAKALPLLQAFHQVYPNNRNRSFVAKALQANQQSAEAIRFLQQYPDPQGSVVLASLQIAELAITENNYPLAIEEYKKILIQDPNNPRALNNLAYLLMEQKKYDEALKYAKKAVDLAPSNPSLLDTYGMALFRFNKLSEAVKYLEKAHGIVPESNQISLHYAEALAALNNNVAAAKILAKISADEPKWQAEITRIKAMM
jgi:putative PEP-CTERM system TPR-repeat lipoprotein